MLQRSSGHGFTSDATTSRGGAASLLYFLTARVKIRQGRSSAAQAAVQVYRTAHDTVPASPVVRAALPLDATLSWEQAVDRIAALILDDIWDAGVTSDVGIWGKACSRHEAESLLRAAVDAGAVRTSEPAAELRLIS
jgi:hypothetical protein